MTNVVLSIRVQDNLLKKLDDEAALHRLSRSEFMKLLVENCSECYDIVAQKKLERSAKMVELESQAGEWMVDKVLTNKIAPEMLFILGGVWHKLGHDMMGLAKERFDVNDTHKVDAVVEQLDKEVGES